MHSCNGYFTQVSEPWPMGLLFGRVITHEMQPSSLHVLLRCSGRVSCSVCDAFIRCLIIQSYVFDCSLEHLLFQRNVAFTEWFKLDKMAQYHDVIVAEDFMQYLAPDHWPPTNRIGFCFSYEEKRDCKMKEGITG